MCCGFNCLLYVTYPHILSIKLFCSCLYNVVRMYNIEGPFKMESKLYIIMRIPSLRSGILCDRCDSCWNSQPAHEHLAHRDATGRSICHTLTGEDHGSAGLHDTPKRKSENSAALIANSGVVFDLCLLCIQHLNGVRTVHTLYRLKVDTLDGVRRLYI